MVDKVITNRRYEYVRAGILKIIQPPKDRYLDFFTLKKGFCSQNFGQIEVNYRVPNGLPTRV